MWTGTPDSAGSWAYSIRHEAGEVGRVELARMSDSGRVVIDGQELRIWRPGVFLGPYLLQSQQERLATATPVALRPDFEVELSGFEPIRLGVAEDQPERLDFEVMEGDRNLGGLRHDGQLSRRLEVQLQPHLEPRWGLFLVWLACLSWRREPGSWGGMA